MIIGLDIGNSNTKSSTGVIIESKVSKATTLSQCDCMVLNNTQYFLGEGEYDTAFRKIDKKNYIHLLYGALALSTKDVFNQIVLGLPLSQFKEDSEALKLKVMSYRDNFIEFNGVESHIIIDEVEVVPEGVLTVEQDYEGIIIDIGGGTTDCCLVENISGRRKIQNPYSDPIGTQKLYSDFVKLINSKYGLDLIPNDTERILKKGLKIDGKYEDFSFAIEVFKGFTDRLIGRLQREYSLRTNDVALVGGGATLLYKPITNRIKNCSIVDNSLFANAIAYENYGKEIWK